MNMKNTYSPQAASPTVAAPWANLAQTPAASTPPPVRSPAPASASDPMSMIEGMRRAAASEGSVGTLVQPPAPAEAIAADVQLSDEQQAMIDAALGVYDEPRDVLVRATVGTGKTTAIQELVSIAAARGMKVLYQTYSRLLKQEAKERVRGAYVQNYHGLVYPYLLRAGIKCGIGESIQRFNDAFERFRDQVPAYDMIVVDEYQDTNSEYARLLENIKSCNPQARIVLVGDMEQKVRDDTTFDVMKWVESFTTDVVELPFTRSFRMGPEMGEKLAASWRKEIIGVNEEQEVIWASYGQALSMMKRMEPSELLALGKRRGDLARALNTLESSNPEKFNKSTVYASIKDSDGNIKHGQDSAVFTTFDASKGLERDTCFVFDYDDENWRMRTNMPGTDPEILRNVFLVAASRGKRRIVFVESDMAESALAGTKDAIGYVPVSSFSDLPVAKKYPSYVNRSGEVQVLHPSECFEFKYSEDVDAARALLVTRRLDHGSGPVIDLDRADGLVDLAPVVGMWQEALCFDGYNAEHALIECSSQFEERLMRKLGRSEWFDALVLGAAQTDQLRYVDQVDSEPAAPIAEAIRARVAEHLPRTVEVQRGCSLNGKASSDDGHHSSQVAFGGRIDAVADGVAWELKFVGELSADHFLQLGMYLVMSGLKKGILWNVRTNERHEVRVSDAKTFMDAVINCVSKEAYTKFVEEGSR